MLTNALTTNNISLIAEKFKSGEITPYTRITANKTFIGYVIEAESDDPEYDINVKLNLIRLAHQYGADFNLPSKNYGNLSYLPLSNAFDLFSNLEKFKVVELLLQLGADPNKYVDNSFPVLFKKCDAELFKLLLDYRADANFIHHDDKIGNITPLYFNACDPIKVKILLQNNADPLFKNGYTQQTAYDFALEHYRNRSGSQESLQILQEAMVLAKQRKVTPSANQPELYKNAVLELERSLVSNERTTTAAIVGALRHMHNAELILTK